MIVDPAPPVLTEAALEGARRIVDRLPWHPSVPEEERRATVAEIAEHLSRHLRDEFSPASGWDDAARWDEARSPTPSWRRSARRSSPGSG